MLRVYFSKLLYEIYFTEAVKTKGKSAKKMVIE